MRTDLALHYLRDPSLSISQIAWLVGYGNVSSVSHACKRWTGMNPARMRDRLLTAASRFGKSYQGGSRPRAVRKLSG